MTAARSPWLVCRRRQPAARLRLYCFPHTGGSPGEYVRWADELPEIEIWGIQPPGRGARITETPLASIEAFTAGLLSDTGFAAPFMFFGHSLGGLTAFETARALRAAGAPLPRRLILSAYPAPHLEHPRSPLHALGDAELMTEVGRRYGLPETLTGNPELLRLVVPAYRADFTIFETYRYRPAPPLPVPFSVLDGDADVAAPLLAGWRQHTSAGCTVELLPGGHFYLREQPGAFLEVLRRLACP